MQEINIIENILKTKYTLDNNFGRYSKCYIMTTENIKNFLQLFDINEKEVLTVAGSGDQMLNLYLMGAKHVTCFDINPLAFKQVKLKKAAVSVLSYEEYLNFFFRDSGFFFNYQLFLKMIPKLDKDTVQFFNYLYDNFSILDFTSRMYYRFNPKLELMKKMNAYLDEDNYYQLASILEDKDISYIDSDVLNLRDSIRYQTFDLILLSNISDDIENIWTRDQLINFKELIHTLSKSLNDDGIIQAGYIYDFYHQRQTNIFANNQERRKVFTTDEFYTYMLPSYNSHSESDAAIVYQKKVKNKDQIKK